MTSLILWKDSSALGRVNVESDDGELVLGDFEQLAGYENYAELFSEYETAADEQLLVEIDRLDKIIGACDFKITEPNGSPARPIGDVQIGRSRISFRWIDVRTGSLLPSATPRS